MLHGSQVRCFVRLVESGLISGRIEHTKDPGIPNDFPYKDQILAEVQEERRLVRSTSLLLRLRSFL